MSTNNFLNPGRNSVFSVVLDEPTLYLGKSTGTKVIRGEVIVNFTKDTAIQGPIALVFQGVQTYYPWRGKSYHCSLCRLLVLTTLKKL